MHGLMMDFPLTLQAIFRHAVASFRGARSSRVERTSDSTAILRRFGAARAASPARFSKLGVLPAIGWPRSAGTTTSISRRTSGSRLGDVLHTLNLRLHPKELAYIATTLAIKALIVDQTLLPLWMRLQGDGASSTCSWSRTATEEPLSPRPDPPRRTSEDPAARREPGCGDVLHDRHDRPAQGRVDSHRATILHATDAGLRSLDVRVREADVLLPGGADVPRQRRGLPRSSRRCSAPSGASRARTSIPSLLDRFRPAARHRRRPVFRRSGWGSCSCSTPIPASGTCLHMKGMLVGGSAVRALDDRCVQENGTASRSCRAGG